MKKYKLDRNYGKAQTLKEADNYQEYWLQKDVSERLSAAWYLICISNGYSIDNPPKLDKTIFGMRKHQS